MRATTFQVSVLLVGGVKLRFRHPLDVSAVAEIADPVTVPLLSGVGVDAIVSAVAAALAPRV